VQFIEEIYQGAGAPLTMGLPPSFLGYNDDIPIRTLDLELAESFFRDAHDGQLWDTGFQFTALYNEGNTTREAMLAIMKDNLEFLNPNFRMNIRSLPWSDFLARTAEKKAPIFVLGWGADYADPRNFINTFYSNTGFYSARTSIDLPEMQGLIDQANEIVDPESRAFLYEQIGALHYDLAPLIPAPNATPFMVVSDDLQGVYRNPMRSWAYQYKDVSK
jgi:peptide/nickel transport system substrate-binding protein